MRSEPKIVVSFFLLYLVMPVPIIVVPVPINPAHFILDLPDITLTEIMICKIFQKEISSA